MNQTQPTRADDCERMLRILIEAPPEGLSLDEIQAVTEQQGEKLSLRTINIILVDLMGQIRSEKVRGRRGQKVTKFNLKRRD
jgi:hypothetical protein